MQAVNGEGGRVEGQGLSEQGELSHLFFTDLPPICVLRIIHFTSPYALS